MQDIELHAFAELELGFLDRGILKFEDMTAVQANDVIVVVRFRELVHVLAKTVREAFLNDPGLEKKRNCSINSRGTDP